MWSIGIYSGESPFDLAPFRGVDNPVLTRHAINDISAEFVADPFMISVAGVWYMFFEVMNQETKKGEIGLATSTDGLVWQYRQIVLTETFHLSYPYVFESNGEYFMIPETLQAGSVGLYIAQSFPTHWSYTGPLIEGSYADPSVFRFENRWWLFACSTPYEHDGLCLYFAEHLTGPWIPHPQSPIIEGNKHNARPAGRVVISMDKIVRFSQDRRTTVLKYGPLRFVS